MGKTNEKQIMFYKNKIYNQLNELESLGYINEKEKQSMMEITSLCDDYEQLKEMSDLSLQKQYAEYFRSISGSNMIEVIKESLPEQVKETKDLENTDEEQYDESSNIYENELDRTAAALSLLARLQDKEKYGFDPEALDIDSYDSDEADQDSDYFNEADEYTEEEEDIDSYFENDDQYDDNNFDETEGINEEITDSGDENYDYDSDYYNQYENYEDTEDSENGENSEEEPESTSENYYDDYFIDDTEIEEDDDDNDDSYYSDYEEDDNYNWSTDGIFNSDSDLDSGSLSDADFIAENNSDNSSEWFTESGYEDSYFDDNDDTDSDDSDDSDDDYFGDDDSESDDDYFSGDDDESDEDNYFNDDGSDEGPDDDYFLDDDSDGEADDDYFNDDSDSDEDYFNDDDSDSESDDDYFGDDDETEDSDDDYFGDDDDDDTDSYFDEDDDDESINQDGLIDNDYYDYETDDIDEGITENDVDIDNGSWFKGESKNTSNKTSKPKDELKKEKTFTKGEHAKETQAMFDNLGKTINIGVRLLNKARKQSKKF